jgi:hypothetical protein
VGGLDRGRGRGIDRLIDRVFDRGVSNIDSCLGSQ